MKNQKSKKKSNIFSSSNNKMQELTSSFLTKKNEDTKQTKQENVKKTNKLNTQVKISLSLQENSPKKHVNLTIREHQLKKLKKLAAMSNQSVSAFIENIISQFPDFE